jgi:threonine dehydrogenase-like Zn-dependent dehydrogenase
LRAVQLTAQGPVLDGHVPEPAPGPGAAVVRVRCAAVFVPPPGIPGTTPGRDFVGVIDRLHESAEPGDRRRLIGQRIVGLADIACTRCDLCRSGLSVHCREARTLGDQATPGCLAERLALPVRNLIAVPDALADDAAVFAPTLALAIHAAQAVRIEGGAFVTVLGDSALALLCAQVLRTRTPAVRLLGRRPERFTLCERWGVRHRHEAEAGRRRDQSAVIDCTGEGLALAMQIVRPRGMIVVPEGHGPPIEPRAIVESELVVIGVRAGPLRDAIAMLASGAVDTLPLVSRRGRLDQAPAMLRAADGLAQIVDF